MIVKMLKPVFVTLLLLLVVGCATAPTPDKMQADISGYTLPYLPEPGKAIVYVVRPSSLGGLIRFNVFVDDQLDNSEMGYTRGGQYIYFNLQPGEHHIYSKAENWAETFVTAHAGDIIFLEQNPTLGIIMARNEVTQLQDYEGKYQVKHITIGTIKKIDK